MFICSHVYVYACTFTCARIDAAHTFETTLMLPLVI